MNLWKAIKVFVTVYFQGIVNINTTNKRQRA